MMPPASKVQPQTIIAGKYRLIGQIGKGGMAAAYLATYMHSSGIIKLVALKCLHPHLMNEPDFAPMFLAEAQLSMRLEHPNVVQTHDVGVDENYFIVMEFIQGQAQSAIRSRSVNKSSDLKLHTVPLNHQLHILMEVLSGLAYAHALVELDGTTTHLVHRDVSPQNVMVGYDGRVKLLDFGIAKALDQSGQTRTGIIKGKCAYMPAEQFGGRGVDHRADIFAVGVMLWESMTGKRLWAGKKDGEIFRAVAHGDIPKPSAHVENANLGLEAICMKALAQRKEDRYESAQAMRDAIEEVVNQNPSLRSSTSKLGAYVSEIFAAEKVKMREAIAAALVGETPKFDIAPASVTGSSIVNFGPASMANPSSSSKISATPAPSSDSEITPVSVAENSATRVAERAPPGATPRPDKVPRVSTAYSRVRRELAVPWWRTLRGRLAALGGLAAVGAVMGYVATRAPEPSAECTVMVRPEPEGSIVTIDGKPLSGSPPVIRIPRDNREHSLRVESDGFVPQEQKVVSNTDSVSLRVHLVRAK